MSTSSAASVRSSDLRAAFAGDPIPLRYEVLAEIPADRDSFTQGLEFTPDGRLFESSGRYGQSALRQIDPATGATIDEVLVDPTWWAEGITLVTNDGTPEMAMLTWREGIVAFYDPDTLTERRRASYDGEGWGLCQLDDGTLMMSNGTPDLTRRDPVTFDVIGRVTVTRSGKALANINELECVDGLVWANVWQTEWIVVIDPRTGDVVAELDVSGMLDRKANPGADVLNGIALVPGTTDEFWIAGKFWPSTWVVRVQPA
jgi:glutamine cyclotransferase